ncbi:hypothetical protein QBC41DRAFT_301312 [Cercophora samala]|uniref:Uncharacterized protein n=1 Tax=Cercophora samala TaxID=330535 RepID=A0AA39ZGU5_9PEZI|nr:hypothetical protein QBC41DRAFT_301312 [Cercophora samala]
MESIQLAQMLADLSDLNAAQEASAAVALVNANKNLNQPTTTTPSDASQPSDLVRPPIRPGQRNHQRTGSAGSLGSSSFLSRAASPAKFDKYGRRILTPPNTRANSSYGSIPGTPRGEVSSIPGQRSRLDFCLHHSPVPILKGRSFEPQQITDDDVDRAGSLMALYEIRAKLKDQDNRGLLKLREKITALQNSRLQQERLEKGGSPLTGFAGENVHKSRYSYPKHS